MKKATTSRRKRTIRYRTAYRYPNAADRRYHLDRLTDIALAAATACGTITIIGFLFTMA